MDAEEEGCEPGAQADEHLGKIDGGHRMWVWTGPAGNAVTFCAQLGRTLAYIASSW